MIELVKDYLWVLPVAIFVAWLLARAAGAGWFGAKFHYQRKFVDKLTGEEKHGK